MAPAKRGYIPLVADAGCPVRLLAAAYFASAARSPGRPRRRHDLQADPAFSATDPTDVLQLGNLKLRCAETRCCRFAELVQPERIPLDIPPLMVILTDANERTSAFCPSAFKRLGSNPARPFLSKIYQDPPAGTQNGRRNFGSVKPTPIRGPFRAQTRQMPNACAPWRLGARNVGCRQSRSDSKIRAAIDEHSKNRVGLTDVGDGAQVFLDIERLAPSIEAGRYPMRIR